MKTHVCNVCGHALNATTYSTILQITFVYYVGMSNNNNSRWLIRKQNAIHWMNSSVSTLWYHNHLHVKENTSNKTSYEQPFENFEILQILTTIKKTNNKIRLNIHRCWTGNKFNFLNLYTQIIGLELFGHRRNVVPYVQLCDIIGIQTHFTNMYMAWIGS